MHDVTLKTAAAPVVVRRVGGLTLILGALLALALAFVIWAALAAVRPTWPDSASATWTARAERTVQPGETLRRTVSAPGRWSGIEIPLAPAATGPVEIRIEAADASRSARIDLAGDAAISLTFDSLPSAGDLTVIVTVPPDGAELPIKIQSIADPTTMAFRLLRQWTWTDLATAALGRVTSHASLFAGTVSWLLVPGFLVWWLVGRPFAGRSIADLIAVAPLVAALSMATIVTVAAVLSYLPFRWPPIFLPLILAAGIVAVVAMSSRHRPALVVRRSIAHGDLAALLVAGGLVATRVGAVVDWTGLPGVDGTAIADFAVRILGRGAMLDLSDSAVAGIGDFYHLGLSTIVAVVAATASADLDATTLLVGQAVQVIAVLGVGAIIRAWRGSGWSMAAGMLVAGFVLPLPGFATAWSRYTELAGLAIAAPLFAMLGLTLGARTRQKAIRYAMLVGLLGGALALTHYRALAFALLAAPTLFIAPARSIRRPGLHAVAAGTATAVVLLAPWLVRVIQTFWLPTAIAEPSAPQEMPWWTLQSGSADRLIWAMAIATVPLLALSGWRLVRPLLAILWIGASLALLIVPGVLGVRLGVAVNPLSAAIAFYLPIGLWAGWCVAALLRATTLPRFVAAPLTIATVGAVLALSARPGTLDARLPDLQIVTPADRAAYRWISTELPETARFVVNPTPWAYGYVIGSDGGYWLRVFTGRETLVPPLSYVYQPRSAVEAISAQALLTEQAAADPDRLLGLWRDQGWTHLYLGRRGGVLDPVVWRTDPRVRVVYDRDGVLIVALPS